MEICSSHSADPIQMKRMVGTALGLSVRLSMAIQAVIQSLGVQPQLCCAETAVEA